MTKEEYEKLLKSDYWKGFSYSLIKERNFTCEDCGRTFYNERNKLQVHHLVYRDIKPWSYKPEELIVLCEDCHKKRHGIISESDKQDYSGIVKDTRTISSGDIEKEIPSSNLNGNQKKKIIKYIILGVLILFAFLGVRKISMTPTVVHQKEKESIQVPSSNARQEKTPARPPYIPQKNYATSPNKVVIPEPEEFLSSTENNETLENNEKELTTMELLERRQHADVVRQAKRAGVSSEGTTMEILDRIQHADVVRQAKRAGVSSEGTTMEILDRIQHADVVRQAKRAGVSSEGTTMEILDRIQHADVVRQAKRAGVSSEGTTMEILDRIQHADVVRQAKRAGVSSEGTTMEILDRIQRKEMEKYNY